MPEITRMVREDHILYPVLAHGGGIDGRDHSDKPKIIGYYHSIEEAQEAIDKFWGKNGSVQEPIICDYLEVMKDVKRNLTTLEIYVLKEKTGIDLNENFKKMK